MPEPSSFTQRLWMPYDTKNKENPYPMYKRLRETDPIHIDQYSKVCVLTKYEDVKLALSDKRFGNTLTRNQFAMDLPYFFKIIPSWILFREGVYHENLRNALKAVFDWKQVQKVVDEVGSELRAELLAQKSFDVVNDLAYQFPTRVIGSLLGFDRKDIHLLKEWSQALIWAGNPYLSPKRYRSLEENAKAFYHYLDSIYQNPGRLGENSIFKRLLDLRSKEGETLFTKDELFGLVVFLFFSGEETVANLIGNIFYHLNQKPEVFKDLKENPGRQSTAIEEFIRFDSSMQHTLRVVLADSVLLGEKELKKGDIVIPVIGAANHDPEVFANPEKLQFDRKKYNHLSFGSGRHYCFGARLARMELEASLKLILNDLESYKLIDQSYDRIENVMFRGFKELRVNKI